MAGVVAAVEISMYKNAFTKEPQRDIPAVQLLREIKNGKYRAAIEALRPLADAAHVAYQQRGGQPPKTQAEHDYTAKKDKLPCATFSGTFSYLNADNLTVHSGLVGLDIDHLETDAIPELLRRLQREPWIAYAFRSVSWHGVKVGIRIEAQYHLESFNAAAAYLAECYDVEVDQSGKDVSRLCFVSYDPDLYLNDSAEIFAVDHTETVSAAPPPAPIARPATNGHSAPVRREISIDDVRAMLRYVPSRPDYDTWLRVVSAIASEFPEGDTIGVCQEWSPEEKPGEYARKYAKRLKDVSMGTLVYMAKERGYQPPARERQVRTMGAGLAPSGQTAINGHADPETPPDDDELLAGIYMPDWGNIPPPSKAVITLNGDRIGSRGNLTTIISNPGFGKSAICEVLCAYRYNPECDAFGLAVDVEGSVLYADTERTLEDHSRSWVSMTRRAGIVAGEIVDPDLVRYMNFKMIASLEERKRKLAGIIDRFNVGLLLLDTITDFIRDPNDLGECDDFVRWLLATAEASKFAVLATIHQNPTGTGEKARGAIGSEMQRRAEANLVLRRDDDTNVRTLTTKFAHGKVRNADDRLETHFTWNKELGMFSSCEGGATTISPQVSAKLKSLVDDLYADKMAYAYSDLLAVVMERAGIQERQAKRRITSMRMAGLVMVDLAGLYLRMANQNDPEAF